jgi:hypothetical protein
MATAVPRLDLQNTEQNLPDADTQQLHKVQLQRLAETLQKQRDGAAIEDKLRSQASDLLFCCTRAWTAAACICLPRNGFIYFVCAQLTMQLPGVTAWHDRTVPSPTQHQSRSCR